MTDAALIATLERLAASGAQQEAYLRRLGTAPSLDELALEFDDEYAPLRHRPSDPQASTFDEALAALDACLRRFGGASNAHLWVVEALERPEWQEVRRLAQRALAERPD